MTGACFEVAPESFSESLRTSSINRCNSHLIFGALDSVTRRYNVSCMVLAYKRNRFSNGAALVLAVLFLVANGATSKRLVPAGSAKLITFDHEVRRDLTRAERQSLKTSAASVTGELPSPGQYAAVFAGPRQTAQDSYRIFRLPTRLPSRSIFLDLSPVLNL